MQLGMVHRLQTRATFIACGLGACDGKFAFAICRDCQKVVEIPRAAMLAKTSQLERHLLGFDFLDVAKIIRQIKAEKVPAVFMENITDHRLLDQIGRETGAKISGTLYTDVVAA